MNGETSMEKVIDVEATSLRIGEMIEEKGLTARQIQRQLDLDTIQAVYKWMKPQYNSIPSIDNLVKLSKLLGCSLEDILVAKDK